MVFESVVVDILNRYLKPYVKRLDTSQLKVGVWKGHARLEKLELKEDLFAEADLDIPLKVKGSYIGKLEMRIPWKHLTRDPLEIWIDEVYIIVGPEFETSYDPEKDLKRQRKQKEKKIEEFQKAAKKKKKKEKEARKGKKKKDSDKPDSFVEKMVAHLMKNLLVKVRDIHVRYEDSETNPNTTIAAGITLHSLELKSTDGNWQPTIIKETATLINKLLELNCLGLYWTTFAQSLASLSTEEMVEAMRDSIARPALEPPPTNEYLLMPVSATAKLKMNLKPEADLSIPQLWMEVECEDINLSLHEKQYKSLLNMLDSFDRHALAQKYLKYKPEHPVSEDLRGWWRYAITAVLEEDVKKRTKMWSWRHIKHHREVCRLYQQRYREKVHSLSPSPSLLQEIQALEDQLDWFNIVICRKKEKYKPKKAITAQAAHRPPSPMHPRPSTHASPSPSTPSHLTPPQTPQPPLTVTPPSPGATRRTVVSESSKSKKKKKEKEGKKKGGFFSNLKRRLKHGDKGNEGGDPGEGGVSGDPVVRGATATRGGKIAAPSSDTTIEETDGESEEKERVEFYKAIGYSEDEVFEFPKEYIAHKVFVSINSLSLDLLGKKQLGSLVTKSIELSVFNRPTTNAVSVSASVGSMYMTGVPHDSCPTILLSSQVVGVTTTTAGDTPLLKFGLEMNPLDQSDMDMVIRADLRPIQITYDAETVDGLIAVFKPQKNIHLQELTQAASASWDQLKEQTSAGLQNALKNRKQLAVDVTLHSPFLVVPDHGLYSANANLLVVDLGRLSVTGKTNDPKALRKASREVGNMDHYYDKFTVGLEGMQVLAAKPGEDWKGAMTKGSSPLHILDPTGFEVQLKKSIVDDDAFLPSLRVEGTLPRFEVKISDEKLMTLVKVASTLEKPPSLISTSRYYDKLPVPKLSKHLLDNANQVVDTISFDTMSVSSFGDEDSDDDTVPLHPTPGERETGDQPKIDDTARHVFTDVSVKLAIEEIALKLTQMQGPSREFRQPLLDVIIRNMHADVVDRKWDTQGSVTMGTITVLDYITVDSVGEPTCLLKTEALNDGNFISTRFVTVSKAGVDFAAKYTGLQDSVSAQMSLVKLKLHRQTLVALVEYFMSLKPAIESPPVEAPDGMEIEHPAAKINPQDVKSTRSSVKDFHFDAEFEGIDIALADEDHDVLQAAVKGFAVKGTIQKNKATVSASMEDLELVDPNPEARIPKIVSKVDESKKMITLNVVAYNKDAHERDPQDLNWLDTSLKTEIQRIAVQLDTTFLITMLEFVKHLNINTKALQTAAKATAGTATATVTAIKETTKSAHRIKIDISLHAPLLVLPYHTRTTEGEIYIDLGDFQLSNRFLHGSELIGVDTLETMSLRDGRTVLDRIEIHITSVQIYRKSRSTVCLLANREHCLSDSRSTILEPLAFTAHVIRNISIPTHRFPNVSVQLGLGAMKFHLHKEDLNALITIGLASTMINDALAPAPKPKAVPKLQRKDTQSDVCQLESLPSGQLVPPGGVLKSTTRSVSNLTGVDTIMEVKVRATLKSLSVDLTADSGPLLKVVVSGLETDINVFKETVLVKSSVDTLSVVDLKDGVRHCKVVTLAEGTSKVSSLELKVMLGKDHNPLDPLGEVKANIAQVQFILLIPFVFRVVDFVQSLDVNPNLVTKATKAAQDGAVAVTAYTEDKYFKVDVVVDAPVLFLPVSEESPQSFVLDLGSMSIQNTLLIPDRTAGHIGIDAYGIKLDSFKVSRAFLDYSREGSAVISERVLLQPFRMLLAVERNLCPWYISIPILTVNCTMGELQIFLGREDLKYLNDFGMDIAERATVRSSKGESEMRSAIKKGLTSEKAPESPPQPPPAEAEVCTKVQVLSSLKKFELKLFDKEPELTPDDGTSTSLAEMEDYALASLQLVSMELKTKVFSNGDVDVEATMKDVALCDDQKHRQGRNTGNRVIQHYTSNPLLAYTGKLDSPIVSISYLQREKQHFIILKGENLLVLSDVEFLQGIIEYFTAIFGKPKQREIKEPPLEERDQLAEDAPSPPKKGEEVTVATPKPFPKIKVEASIRNFRVAIIETVEMIDPQTPDLAEPQKKEEQEPQALTLKVSVYFHVQLTETSKQGSLNIADLGISTSSFFNLDNTTSWVLLPCSMLFTMIGPLDKPGMDVTGMIEYVSLTLSPPVMRLIIHAVKALIPQQEKKRQAPPQDLWEKKPLERSKLWFLLPVPLYKAAIADKEIKEKGETLTLSVESVEIILESESTHRSKGHPVLSVNSNAVVQVFEWTGELLVKGDIHCEASYYNEKLSIWEPLLEPLENSKGRLEQWVISTEVKKLTPKAAMNGTEADKPEPKFSVSLSATTPLQLTITKISLQLIKNLVEAYSREYGKQVEGNVKVQTLTGNPFTIVNKLGKGVPIFLKPGSSLKGYYKDGTNGTRDCRFFAAVYLLLRFIIFLVFAITRSAAFYAVAGLVFIGVAMILAIVQPYKAAFAVYNVVDIVFVLTMAMWCGTAVFYIIAKAKGRYLLVVSLIVSSLVGALPLLYLVAILLHWICSRRGIGQRLVQSVKSRIGSVCKRAHSTGLEESLPDRIINLHLYQDYPMANNSERFSDQAYSSMNIEENTTT